MLSIHEKEIILEKIWQGKRYSAQSLLTRSGKKLDVLFRGTKNTDGGPDFKDAIIKISGILLKGDIELHLEDSGWYAHKHHTDPKYNRVMLHVVAGYSSGEYFVEREDGVKVEQLCIPISEDEINLWKKENSKPPSYPERLEIVESCPLSKCPTSEIWATIEAAGWERFFHKVEQISETRLNKTWDQILYEKILEALGYSKNQIPFRKLAQLVPFELVLSEMQWVGEEIAHSRCAAMLFGAAGMLPSHEDTSTYNSENREYIETLKRLWIEISKRRTLKSMQQSEWQFFRLRPQNFPTRRIAGITKLLSKFSKEGFLQKLYKTVIVYSKDVRKIPSELENIFCQKSYGFWKSHYTFTNAPPNLKQSYNEVLIGKGRSRDIAINIILPILYCYALEADDKKLKTVIYEVQKTYPSSENNSIIKKMKKQLFRNDDMKRLNIKSAYQQQGLIQLDKLYCSHMKCERCLSLQNLEF